MSLANVYVKDLLSKEPKVGAFFFSLARSRAQTSSQEVVAFRASLTLGDALDVMGHYEIFSAPLLSDAGELASLFFLSLRPRARFLGTCLGRVDYLDLLCQLVQLTSDANEAQAWPPARNIQAEDLDLMMRRANDWTLHELLKSGSVGVSKSDPFFYTTPSSTLVEALAHFGRGVHHLLVVEDGKVRLPSPPPSPSHLLSLPSQVVGLVSQSDVLAYLAKHMSALSSLPASTVSQLGLGERPVFSVRNSDCALDSFFELFVEGVSGGAIINSEGKLVGNLSRQDLKGTQGGTGFKVLSESIMHYQRKHRVALAQRLVTVNADSPVGDIITTMAREKTQRVFVVKEGMYPRGLVTQTDVCRVVYEHFVAAADRLSKREVKALMMEHARHKLEFPLVFPPK